MTRFDSPPAELDAALLGLPVPVAVPPPGPQALQPEPHHSQVTAELIVHAKSFDAMHRQAMALSDLLVHSQAYLTIRMQHSFVSFYYVPAARLNV